MVDVEKVVEAVPVNVDEIDNDAFDDSIEVNDDDIFVELSLFIDGDDNNEIGIVVNKEVDIVELSFFIDVGTVVINFFIDVEDINVVGIFMISFIIDVDDVRDVGVDEENFDISSLSSFIKVSLAK